ncbi:MAG: ABC transporter ATP-binding protein [Armatimonadota bacterium]|jgi:putative ABC transport system ATP-binding protein
MLQDPHVGLAAQPPSAGQPNRCNDGAAVVFTEDLSKQYLAGAASVHALRSISITVARGEMVAIMGPSGSGKTTLLNLLGCVDRPTRGHYWLDAEDASRLADGALSRIRNEKIGFIFQTFNLLPRLTALDNVRLPLLYSHRRIPREGPLAALHRVGLAQRTHHRPDQLSGGQQQRVAIARALVMQPSIVLADEPTGNLDSRSGEEIMQILQQLNGEGVTIITVTHDPRVAQHSTRIIEMRDGRAIADRPISDRLEAGKVLAGMPAPESDSVGGGQS